LTQVQRARDGRMIAVDDDVQGIAMRLREIDPSLRLSVSEATGHFVVKQRLERPDGSIKETLVTTSTSCDGRLLDRIARIASEDYDLAAELEDIDDEAKRADDHAFSEKVGPLAEQLAFAMRKDLGVKGRISVPRAA
jgi:hypothetical protein